jgi:hypothetical protein
VFCKDDRGWLRLSVTNPMAIHALECHAMAFDKLDCHSSGILRSRMPQLWHSTSKIAILISVVAIELAECHAWHSTRSIAILISVVAIELVECHAWHSTITIAILISVVAIELVECPAPGIRQSKLPRRGDLERRSPRRSVFVNVGERTVGESVAGRTKVRAATTSLFRMCFYFSSLSQNKLTQVEEEKSSSRLLSSQIENLF